MFSPLRAWLTTATGSETHTVTVTTATTTQPTATGTAVTAAQTRAGKMATLTFAVESPSTAAGTRLLPMSRSARSVLLSSGVTVSATSGTMLSPPNKVQRMSTSTVGPAVGMVGIAAGSLVSSRSRRAVGLAHTPWRTAWILQPLTLATKL